MFVRLRGGPYRLWRAVDEQGQELDILLQKRRDTAAAEQFFKRILRNHSAPQVIVTDQLRSYPVAKARVPALAKTKHIFVRAAARVNNRTENSHQPTRERDQSDWGDKQRRRAYRLRRPMSSLIPYPLSFNLRCIDARRDQDASPVGRQVRCEATPCILPS